MDLQRCRQIEADRRTRKIRDSGNDWRQGRVARIDRCDLIIRGVARVQRDLKEIYYES